MRRAVLASIVLATIVLVTTIARAEPPGLTIATPLTAGPTLDTTLEATTPKVETISYRWQLVVSDLAALGTAIVSAQPDVGPPDLLAQVALGTYVLGAPMVHAANGHGARALGSLALRVALPAIGALIGVSVQGQSTCENCIDTAPPIQGLLLGIGIGGLTALVVDYAVLARPEKVTRRGWAPMAAPAKGGATVGLSARF